MWDNKRKHVTNRQSWSSSWDALQTCVYFPWSPNWCLEKVPFSNNSNSYFLWVGAVKISHGKDRSLCFWEILCCSIMPRIVGSIKVTRRKYVKLANLCTHVRRGAHHKCLSRNRLANLPVRFFSSLFRILLLTFILEACLSQLILTLTSPKIINSSTSVFISRGPWSLSWIPICLNIACCTWQWRILPSI